MSEGDGAVRVRPATGDDMPAICDIINHFIHASWVNFRTRPQTPEEWRSSWEHTRERYPWLVATARDRVIGVAYAGAYKPREAYNWCAEVTVYVAADLRRRGVGRALYGRLLPILEAQGYRSLVAVIALPNPASVALHEAFGFEHVGTLQRVGFKLGEWHDTGFWQRMLPGGNAAPAAIRRVAEVEVAGRMLA